MATTHDAYSKPQTLESVSGLTIGPLPRQLHPDRRLGVVFACLDSLIIIGAGALSYKLVHLLEGERTSGTLTDALPLLGLLVCYAVLALVCKAWQGLYASATLHSAQISRVRTVKSIGLASMVFLLLLSLSEQKPVPPLLLVFTMVFSLVGILTMQHLLQRHNLKRIERGIGTQHVLIVGSGQIGRAFRDYLESHSYLGKTFCGFVDCEFQPGSVCLGTPAELPELIRKHFVDEIYFTPEIDRRIIMDVAAKAKEAGVSVKVVPDLYEGLALGASLTYIGNVPVLELSSYAAPPLQMMLKRIMDIFLALSGLILSFPLMLAVAIAIKMDSAGPMIYSAWRVGRKGRTFRCYKFRTMVSGADAMKAKLLTMNERTGATFKIENDPRITKVGRFLRKYSIDELPQFFNVLRGEMSIVGPRPHPIDDFQRYQLPDRRRLDVLPGMTGLWQVSARHSPSFDENVMLDLEYIQNWTILLDIKIILKTIPEILKGSGH